MLRKTYQLMQKTRGLVTDAGEQMWRMGAVSSLGARSFRPGFEQNASFQFCPGNIQPGDPGRGRDLTRFALQSRNDFLQDLFSEKGSKDLDPAFHDFKWILDLQSCGTDDAARAAAKLITLWTRGNVDLSHRMMDASVMYGRVRRMVGASSFFVPFLSDDDLKTVMSGLMHHMHFLKRGTSSSYVFDALYRAAGFVTIGIVTGIPTQEITGVLKQFERAVQMIVLADGGPYTRRPSDLPDILSVLVEMYQVFDGARIPVPSFIAHAIDRMVPALRALRMGDGHMAVFHGGNGKNTGPIDHVLAHVAGCMQGSVAVPLTLPYTGFERLAVGPSVVLMDAGRAVTQSGHHASTTAFEWSAGAVRVVVNCGKHATDPLWGDLLAATSAHSTVTMGHQDNVPVTGMADVDILRDDRNGSMVEVIHNGYQTRNGFIHARKITVSPDGLCVSGDDKMDTSVPPLTPVDYIIRFHLHPCVVPVLMNRGPHEKPIITLTLPDGAVWHFHHDSDALSLDDSVYLGDTGKPVKTRQIVVSGQMMQASKKVKWRFEAV